MSITTAAFRAVDSSERLPEAYVNAYYIDDLKRRIAVARELDDLAVHVPAASSRAKAQAAMSVRDRHSPAGGSSGGECLYTHGDEDSWDREGDD